MIIFIIGNKKYRHDTIFLFIFKIDRDSNEKKFNIYFFCLRCCFPLTNDPSLLYAMLFLSV